MSTQLCRDILKLLSIIRSTSLVVHYFLLFLSDFCSPIELTCPRQAVIVTRQVRRTVYLFIYWCLVNIECVCACVIISNGGRLCACVIIAVIARTHAQCARDDAMSRSTSHKHTRTAQRNMLGYCSSSCQPQISSRHI